MNIRMILVLFILLVITISSFHSPIGTGDFPDENRLTINNSRRFDIYNQTENYTFQSASLTGDFESPHPLMHKIEPGTNYYFQVRTSPYGLTDAHAYYRVLSASGASIGTFEVEMQVRLYIPSTNILLKTGPIDINNGNTYAYVKNAKLLYSEAECS